jgi:NitT/TauT family transport system substrate-binding protein
LSIVDKPVNISPARADAKAVNKSRTERERDVSQELTTKRSWQGSALRLGLAMAFVWGLGAGAPSLARAEEAGAQKLTPLRVQHYQGLLINQNSYIAYYTGLFRKHGLDVTLVPLSSGPAVEAAVHAGSIDIGSQDLDQTMINTHLQNLNFTTICGAEGSYYQVVTRPGFKFEGPMTYPEVMKNFVGKKLGVTALGADTFYFWEALFQAAGLPPDSGTYIATGVGQQSLSAIQHSLVDATMGFEPLTTAEAQTGSTIVLNLAKGEGPPETRDVSPQLTYFVDRKYLASHAETITAFNETIMEAVRFQNDPKNFAAVLAAMKQAMGPLGNMAGFEQIVRDNIGPSSMIAVTTESVRAWLKFTQTFLKFPTDVTAEAIGKEVVWEKACK